MNESLVRMAYGQGGDGMKQTKIYMDEDRLRLLKHLAAEENKPVADLVR